MNTLPFLYFYQISILSPTCVRQPGFKLWCQLFFNLFGHRYS